MLQRSKLQLLDSMAENSILYAPVAEIKIVCLPGLQSTPQYSTPWQRSQLSMPQWKRQKLSACLVYNQIQTLRPHGREVNSLCPHDRDKNCLPAWSTVNSKLPGSMAEKSILYAPNGRDKNCLPAWSTIKSKLLDSMVEKSILYAPMTETKIASLPGLQSTPNSSAPWQRSQFSMPLMAETKIVCLPGLQSNPNSSTPW